MNIILPIHKQYVEKILNHSKIYEFRNRLPNDCQIGDTIYIYETKRNGGQGVVVGECKIEDMLSLTNEQGQFPMFGAYSFIEEYCKKVLKNNDYALKFSECKKYQLENYKYGSLIDFALSEYCMYFLKQGIYPSPLSLIDNEELMVDGRLIARDYNDEKEANRIIDDCDKWLRNMGFYDDNDTSFWKFAIKVKDVVKYQTPKNIDKFKNTSGVSIQKAPQSFQYTIN